MRGFAKGFSPLNIGGEGTPNILLPFIGASRCPNGVEGTGSDSKFLATVKASRIKGTVKLLVLQWLPGVSGKSCTGLNDLSAMDSATMGPG